MMKNRVKKLQLEEERAHKNLEKTRNKADDIVRLKAQNELRARAKEHARKLREEELQRKIQQRALDRATRGGQCSGWAAGTDPGKAAGSARGPAGEATFATGNNQVPACTGREGCAHEAGNLHT